MAFGIFGMANRNQDEAFHLRRSAGPADPGVIHAMSEEAAAFMQTLSAHRALSQEVLSLVEVESQALRQPHADPAQANALAFDSDRRRRTLLPRLDALQVQLRRHRLWWQSLAADQRGSHPDIDALIQINQDLIMRIVFLDRENETIRLRSGMQTATPKSPAPPAPPRPHYVSHLYRQHAS
jgi:hypothetical protein